MTWGIDLESTAMVAMDRHAEMRAYAQQQHALNEALRGSNRRPAIWRRLLRALGGMAPEAKTEPAATQQSLLQN